MAIMTGLYFLPSQCASSSGGAARGWGGVIVRLIANANAAPESAPSGMNHALDAYPS
jgi:hypothetical protein